MKLPPPSLASLLAAAILLPFFPFLPFFPTAADAQTQSVYGDRKDNTADDLLKSITQLPYTWEVPDAKATVVFKTDGTGKQSFFSFTWKVVSPQQIELTMPGNPTKGAIKFSDNYATYSGSGFDGRLFHGNVILPQRPAAQSPVTPPPPLAATPPTASPTAPSTPATPPSSNPFFNDHPVIADNDSDALEHAIINTHFSWEHETGTNLETVVFGPNGTGRCTFFDIAWRVKGPHELELTIPGDKEKGKIILKFNNDYTKYTSTDFDGESPLRGHKIKP